MFSSSLPAALLTLGQEMMDFDVLVALVHVELLHAMCQAVVRDGANSQTEKRQEGGAPRPAAACRHRWAAHGDEPSGMGLATHEGRGWSLPCVWVAQPQRFRKLVCRMGYRCISQLVPYCLATTLVTVLQGGGQPAVSVQRRTQSRP